MEEGGTSPFTEWFAALDATVAAKITVILARNEQGKLSNVNGVGEEVLECRLNFGPGYRVYFGRDGDVLAILLAGGTKKEAATARHRGHASPLGDLRAMQTIGEMNHGSDT